MRPVVREKEKRHRGLRGMSERRLLQAAVAFGCFVPIVGGGLGVVRGPAMVGIAAAPAAADAHFRYLSGLLLGIGLGFLSTVPRIEARGARFRLLAAIVVIGGLGRLLSLALRGAPDIMTLFALAMELAVTPSLALWQGRIARAARATDPQSGRLPARTSERRAPASVPRP
jgi:hypothetical protein